MVYFTVYHRYAGEIIRWGRCTLATDAASQARVEEDEAVHLGAALSFLDYRFIVPSNGAKPYPHEHTEEEKASRRALLLPPPTVDRMDTLIEALQSKGIAITKEDLAAAESSVLAKNPDLARRI